MARNRPRVTARGVHTRELRGRHQYISIYMFPGLLSVISLFDPFSLLPFSPFFPFAITLAYYHQLQRYLEFSRRARTFSSTSPGGDEGLPYPFEAFSLMTCPVWQKIGSTSPSKPGRRAPSDDPFPMAFRRNCIGCTLRGAPETPTLDPSIASCQAALLTFGTQLRAADERV